MNRNSYEAGIGAVITVNSRKYDNVIRRTWTGGLVSYTDELVVLVGRFEDDVKHNDLGQIKKGTVSFEHFWPARWYNIFRFHEPDGALKAYYCNVTMPPVIENGTIDFIDLDIDVVVWPDISYEVVDRDDFEENSIKYGYPDHLKTAAEAAVKELIGLIGSGQLPQPESPAN